MMAGSLYQLLCCLAAFAALCLGQERHHEAALGRALNLQRQRALRGLALLGFMLSWLAVMARADSGIAWAQWVAQLTLAALFVVALATWRPLALPLFALFNAAAALLLLAAGAWMAT